MTGSRTLHACRSLKSERIVKQANATEIDSCLTTGLADLRLLSGYAAWFIVPDLHSRSS